jgi:glycosyltransferase involved in cell wall biosynthesis
MRIAFIAAGAGGMYCGSCLRDAALAKAARALGHEFLLVPLYTPMRIDEEGLAEDHVFLGAVEIYLRAKLPFLRRMRGPLARILGSQRVLRWLSRFALSGRPEDVGKLTISMLKGEEGSQRLAIEDLVAWLRDHGRPEVIHLTNALLLGLAPSLRSRLGVKVVCGLQGEDLFLESLPTKYREEAVRILAARAASVDRLVATSSYYADRASGLFGIDRDRIDVVPSGIDAEAFGAPADAAKGERPPTIGYFARIAPEKGLHLLVEAFLILARREGAGDVRLKVGGYLAGKGIAYAGALRQRIASAGLASRVEVLGTLGAEAKARFFRSIDILSVPTIYPDPKGIFVLEALASGVPVVQPAHGAFPEIVAATGGGLLHEPGDPDDLAAKLASLLDDPRLRTDLGERGRAAVRGRFSARRMAEGTIAVYDRVLSAGRTA